MKFKRNLSSFLQLVLKKKIRTKSEVLTTFVREQIKKFNKNNLNEFILVEIGSYLGESLEIFGNILYDELKNNFKIISIDPYNYDWYDSKLRANSEMSNEKIKSGNEIYKRFIKKISITKFCDNHQHLRISSKEAFKYFVEKEIKIDFCFIDGNHTYNAFKSDFEKFSTLLKKHENYKGLICGHDYDYTFIELLNFLNLNEKEFYSYLNKSTDIDNYKFIDKNGYKRSYHPGILKYFYENKINVQKYEHSFWKCL